MKRDSQNGRSMLEMLGVLAIVGVLTVGGFGLVNKVNTNNQANNVLEEVSSLVSKVRIVARDYSSDDGSFMKYVCKAKAYPDTMDCDLIEGSEEEDTCNCSTFTGNADATYAVAKGTYPILFTLTIGNLTNEMCMSLITGNWGSISTTGFDGFDGVSATDIGAASSACDSDENSLTMKFR